MVSSATLHVVSTELTVGAFAMAGLAFLLAGFASHDRFGLGRHLSLTDHVAHFALAFGMLATPLSVFTGIQASPGEGIDHPLLINKMLLASTSFGLALGVLMSRRTNGPAIWNHRWGRRWQTLGGIGASGLMLLTASLGGTFSRGESLLDGLNLPYENVPLFPLWLSVIIGLMALANLAKMRSVPA